jgi:hypothetical protein
MNRRRALGAGVCVALSPLTGCDWFNGTSAWEEEVQLSDGRTIVVAVKVKYETIGEIGGPSGRVRRQTSLRIKPGQGLPDTEWSQDLAAVLLDVDPATKELLLVATIILCQQWEPWGKPRPAYIEFRLRDGRWQRQLPFTEALFDRPVNLLQSWAKKYRSAYVTLQEKRELDSPSGMAENFKRIMRNYGTSC